MTDRLTFMIVILAMGLAGCASPVDLLAYPKHPAETATSGECTAIAMALKANPAFDSKGTFSVTTKSAISMSTVPFGDFVQSRQQWVAAIFPEIDSVAAQGLGAALANREAAQYLLPCSWANLGIVFGASNDPDINDIATLSAPAASADGRWLLVAGQLERWSPPSDIVTPLSDFACLMERSSAGWRIERCLSVAPPR